MESFYAIVYCQIRAVADEKVSVGLLLRSGNMVKFRYSHDKLTIIKELLPDPAYRLLKAGVRNIESFFDTYEEGRAQTLPENSLFGDLLVPAIEPPRYTDASYISYLNTYASNLLTFSKPFLLTLSRVDDAVYETLYHKFVYESDQILEHGSTIYDRVKKKVNPSIRSHVNLDIELTATEIKDLVIPTKVWFIGQNKVDVTGEIFDFEKKTYFLKNEIANHLHLIHALQGTPKGKKGAHFLVGKEPPKKLSDNHSMWNNVRNLKYVTFVPVGELQQIHEYVIEHKVAPFVKQNMVEEPNDED